MKKELNKLITKDIFDCLTDEDARRLEELRAELNISDDAYQQIKKRLTSPALHEEIAALRKRPRRVVRMMRYAAILVLPLALGIYFLFEGRGDVDRLMVAQENTELQLPVPVREQPKLILDDGRVLSLGRDNMRENVTDHVVNTGNELVYSNSDTVVAFEQVEYHTLEVPKNGEYHLTLADGTKVWFNEESVLRFPVVFSGENREVFLEKGEIYLQVEKDASRPFIVHTRNGDIRVLGTEFNVKSRDKRVVETTLVEGSVCVQRGDANVVLEPNHQAVVGDVIRVSEVTDMDAIISWKDNRFYFKDEELYAILEKLSDWYGFNVFYENQELKHEKYFVSIDKYAEVGKILEVISEVSNIKFKINEKTVIVYR